jgi:hypothetical protein
MGFDPCNCTLKIWKFIWDSNSQHESSLGSVRVRSLTLFALPGACEMLPESPSWPATLQPLALVASPRLGLRQKMLTKVHNLWSCNPLVRTWSMIMEARGSIFNICNLCSCLGG